MSVCPNYDDCIGTNYEYMCPNMIGGVKIIEIPPRISVKILEAENLKEHILLFSTS